MHGFHASPRLQLHPALRPGLAPNVGLIILARSLRPTTRTSPGQQPTTRIASTTWPLSARSPPSPATTTCHPMTKMPSWLTLPMSVLLKILMFNDKVVFIFRLVHSPYLWLPATSRTTTAESSPAAPTTRTSNSTTLSSSLGTVQTSAPLVLSTTGWSGTAGENLGERTVTSGHIRINFYQPFYILLQGSLGKPPHSVAWTRKHLDTSAR